MSSPSASGSGVGAVRGAITVPSNSAEDILASTARLIGVLADVNHIQPSRVVSAIFTATADLDADYPAHAARRLGWHDVPLLCAREIPVPGALPRVVRVLLTVSGVAPGARLVPVYLDGAAALRPDLAAGGIMSGETRPGEAPGAIPERDGEEAAAPRRVAIIGLGQIGGSIGLALGLRGGWWRVGFDRDPEVLSAAIARGAIDERAESLAAACELAELAVLATPVDTLPALVDEAAAALPPGAALLDTGSARATVTSALERAAAQGLGAVGGHPLAGSEGRGLAAARADLLAGAPFALAPLSSELPAIVAALVRDVGARPLRVAAEEHDHALARTSHLPYLIACALRRVGEEAAGRELSGPGFRDMTRLAASDERMALAYCRANAREVGAAWRELRAALDQRVSELGGVAGSELPAT